MEEGPCHVPRGSGHPFVVTAFIFDVSLTLSCQGESPFPSRPRDLSVFPQSEPLALLTISSGPKGGPEPVLRAATLRPQLSLAPLSFCCFLPTLLVLCLSLQ